MSEHARLTGHSADAVASARKVEAIAGTLGDLPLTSRRTITSVPRTSPRATIGERASSSRRPSRRSTGITVVSALAWPGSPVVMGRVFWAWALAERGEFEDGLDAGTKRSSWPKRSITRTAWRLRAAVSGTCTDVTGDVRHAIPLLERGVALCREWNLHFLTPTLLEMLGYVYALSGRLPEGLELLQQALASGESTGLTMFSTPAIAHLGEARLLAGEPEAALGLAERALANAREHGQRGQEAWVLRLLAEIAAHRDPPDVGAPRLLPRGNGARRRARHAPAHRALPPRPRQALRRAAARVGQEHLGAAQRCTASWTCASGWSGRGAAD